MCRLIQAGDFKRIFFSLRLEAEQKKYAGQGGDVDDHRRETVNAGVDGLLKLCLLLTYTDS